MSKESLQSLLVIRCLTGTFSMFRQLAPAVLHNVDGLTRQGQLKNADTRQNNECWLPEVTLRRMNITQDTLVSYA